MSDDKQHRIRQRAHAIWERHGRPDGADQDHWHQAAQEIDAEDAAPKKKPAAKAKPAAAAKVTKAAAPKAPAKAPVAKKPAAKAK